MTLKQTLFAAAFTAAVAITGAASAATIYDNGPANGQTDAFTINFGYAVEDSFTVTGNTTATGVDFVTWNQPGDTLNTVDWGIEAAQTYANSGTATVTSSFLGNAAYGYALYSNHISFAGVPLTAGTYYLTLQNASTSFGNPVYWDQNDGPSTAFQTGTGNLAALGGQGYACTGACTFSETFAVTSGGVPEPTTWALMLMGVGGVGGVMRSARRKSGATAAA